MVQFASAFCPSNQPVWRGGHELRDQAELTNGKGGPGNGGDSGEVEWPCLTNGPAPADRGPLKRFFSRAVTWMALFTSVFPALGMGPGTWSNERMNEGRNVGGALPDLLSLSREARNLKVSEKSEL